MLGNHNINKKIIYKWQYTRIMDECVKSGAKGGGCAANNKPDNDFARQDESVKFESFSKLPIFLLPGLHVSDV